MFVVFFIKSNISNIKYGFIINIFDLLFNVNLLPNKFSKHSAILFFFVVFLLSGYMSILSLSKEFELFNFPFLFVFISESESESIFFYIEKPK